MWQDLALIHRESQAGAEPLPGRGQLWRTCLRELLFLEPGHSVEAPSGAHVRRGIEAHRALVEICSGLHSPLFGETEVFGQFRAFRDSAPLGPHWEPLLNAVEEDVKKLRRRFLTELGSQSYGSLARRHLPPQSRVVLVGSGRLAKEILPWLEGQSVVLAARSPEKALEWLPAGTRALSLADLRKEHPFLDGACWVIAAPLENSELEAFWAMNAANVVLDFRGDQRFATVPARARGYLGLRALYQELEAVKQLHERNRDEAMKFAAELCARHANAVVHRPFGWEDAFA